MTTYLVVAKCNKSRGLNVEFKGNTIDEALTIISILVRAFPQIDIICEQTGEVVYTRYVSTDIFVCELEMGTAIVAAEYEITPGE